MTVICDCQIIASDEVKLDFFLQSRTYRSNVNISRGKIKICDPPQKSYVSNLLQLTAKTD